MSNSNLQSSPADIDLGRHRIPDSVRRQAELLEKAQNAKSNKQVRERIMNDPIPADPLDFDGIDPLPQKTKPVQTAPTLPINRFAQEFIYQHPKETEDLIIWYSNLKSNRGKSSPITLGIPGFPFKVKINPMMIKQEDNYLHVFVKADNALDISLPVASEVNLDYNLDGTPFINSQGMFLGEVSFDKNFLFKILIFVVK